MTDNKQRGRLVNKGFDYYQDQLEAIEQMAKDQNTSKAKIVRSIMDAALNLPKEKEEQKNGTENRTTGTEGTIS